MPTMPCLIAKTTYGDISFSSFVCLLSLLPQVSVAFKVFSPIAMHFNFWGLFSVSVVVKCVDFLVTSVLECHVKFYSGVKSGLKEDILLCYFWFKRQLYYILLPAIESTVNRCWLILNVWFLYLGSYKKNTKEKKKIVRKTKGI